MTRRCCVIGGGFIGRHLVEQPLGLGRLLSVVGMSNRELPKLIAPVARSAGFEPKVTTRPARPFDVTASVLDAAKVRAETGWMPSIAIRDCIERTWRRLLDGQGRAGCVCATGR